MPAETASLLTATIAISMLLTPLLLIATDRWWARHLAAHAPPARVAELSEPQAAPIMTPAASRQSPPPRLTVSASGSTASAATWSASATT